MKVCSRSTLGLVIGCLNALVYFVVLILLFVPLKDASGTKQTPIWKDTKEYPMAGTIILIITSVIILVASVFLIIGIAKRRPKLMAPWLYATIISIFINCLIIVWNFINADILFSEVVFIIISVIFFWIIYKLYDEMREGDN